MEIVKSLVITFQLFWSSEGESDCPMAGCHSTAVLQHSWLPTDHPALFPQDIHQTLFNLNLNLISLPKTDGKFIFTQSLCEYCRHCIDMTRIPNFVLVWDRNKEQYIKIDDFKENLEDEMQNIMNANTSSSYSSFFIKISWN